MFHSAESPSAPAEDAGNDEFEGSKLSMAERNDEKAFDSEGVRRSADWLIITEIESEGLLFEAYN